MVRPKRSLSRLNTGKPRHSYAGLEFHDNLVAMKEFFEYRPANW